MREVDSGRGCVGDVDGAVKALLEVGSYPRDMAPVGHHQQRFVAAFASEAGGGIGLAFGGAHVGLEALDLDAASVASDHGAVGAILVDSGRVLTVAIGGRLRD